MTPEKKLDSGSEAPEVSQTKEAPAAEKEPENPWAYLDSPPKDEPEHDDDVLRLKDVSKSWLTGYILKKGCLFFLIIVGVLIGLGTIIGEIEHRARLGRQYSLDCISRLSQIGKAMYYLVDQDGRNETDAAGQNTREEPPFELRPEHTVADLIREILSRGLLREEDFRCRWGEGHPPYLVFPLPASVLLKKPEPHKRIPILMELPEFHRKDETFYKILMWLPGKDSEYVISPRVLWADGGAGIITAEEAEKLISEQAPVPISFDHESETEEKAE